MRLFTKKEKEPKPIAWQYKLAEAKADLQTGIFYKLTIQEDQLHIKVWGGKDERNLAYNRIISVFYGDETEITEKKKWVGRTITGGILFGGVGAIVGAVTGGKKKKEKRRKYLIIAFNEDNYLKFEDTAPGPKSQVVPDELKKRCGINDVKIEWS